MNKASNYLKISGILYLIPATLLILEVPLMGALIFILGIYLVANSFLSQEELNKNKLFLIIATIISIIFNQIAAVLIIMTIDEISSAKKDNINAPPEISSSSRKTDILIKIALGMILISGILFATQSWEIISDLFKLIALIIVGFAFLGLSKFSEVKLKIEKTAKAYFILGLSFFILTWVGIGYFAPFSEWLSYSGGGSGLVYFITFVLAGISFYLISTKFKDPECLYLSYSCIYLSLYAILFLTGLENSGIVLIITLISIILNIIPKNKTIESFQEFNKVITFVIWPLLIITSAEANFYLLLIASFLNIFNTIYTSAKTNNNIENLMSVIIGYILIFIALFNIPFDVDPTLSVFVVMTCFSLVIKYNPFTKNKFLIIPNQIIYHLVSFVTIIIYLFDPSIETIIITGLYLLTNIINSLDLNKTKDKVDLIYQPIVIAYFIMSLITYFDYKYTSVNAILILAVCSIIYVLVHFFTKNKSAKTYYLIATIVTAVLTYFINIITENIIAGTITLLVFSYLYLSLHKKSNLIKIITYIPIIIAVHSLCLFILPSIYGSLLTMLIIGLLMLTTKDKDLELINYIAMIFPLVSLISQLDYRHLTLKMITLTILGLYTLFLVLKIFIKKKSVQDIVAVICYPLIMSIILFRVELAYGIYIGLVTILILFTTFNEDEYKKTFYASIVILIINIIVQLWEFWGIIPFWLYLLLAGIGIIVFVTYKELNKEKQPEIKQVPKVEKIELIEDKTIDKQEEQIKQVEEHIEKEKTIEEQPTQPITKVNEEPREEVEVGRFCPTCGHENKNKGRFCSICGRSLIIKK